MLGFSRNLLRRRPGQGSASARQIGNDAVMTEQDTGGDEAEAFRRLAAFRNEGALCMTLPDSIDYSDEAVLYAGAA